MRKADFPFLADWFAITFRWLSLLGSTIALAMVKNLQWYLIAILMLLIFWNVAMTVLAMLNRRLQGHRFVNIAVDSIVCFFLFTLTGGTTGPLSWISVLSLITAAVYYEWRGSILTALILIISEIGWIYYNSSDILNNWVPILTLVIFNLFLGIILASGSTRLMNSLRQNYKSQVKKRLDMEKNAQIQERNRLQAFYQLTETLSSTLNYSQVLDSILDLSQIALTGQNDPSDTMPSAVLLFSDSKLIIANARRFSPSDLKRSFPGNNGILKDVLTTGIEQTTSSIRTDPELGELYAFQACTNAICLPLARGLDSFGLMIFANPDPLFFTPERVELLVMISHQAVIAIQNASLYQQLQQDNNHIIEMQEEARKKLARDLHDGPTQSVSAIAMRLEVVRKMLTNSPTEVEPELKRIENLARRTTQEIRHMLFTMRPLILESEGLTAALHAIADKTFLTYQQRVRVETNEQVINKMDITKQTVVFYLVEEAVNNARKHANAKLILVRLIANADDAEIAVLEIIDNGIGFNASKIEEDYSHRSSFGMINLKERTELVNGLLNVNSVPGKGTRIQVFIPLSISAVDRLQRGLVNIH
ncbi:MAG: GAF domain-containing sensor histidine kinase [Anaerolineaceae bacterium]